MSALTERLEAAAAAQGILAAAVPDAVSRGTHYFTDEPTDSQIQAWAEGLRDVAPHFFAPPSPPQPTPAEQERQRILDKLSASEKLTRARQDRTVVTRARPQYRTATAEELAQWKGLSTAEQLTAYREQCRIPDQGRG
jgi:hypothetical protein